jgi:glutathione S-transferase
MNQIISILDSYAYRPMVWGVFVERVRMPLSGRGANEAVITESIAAADKCLSALSAIVECAPFLLASRLTLADLHAFPILRYLSLAPEGRNLIASYPALNEWLAMMALRPSTQHTKSKYEVTS